MAAISQTTAQVAIARARRAREAILRIEGASRQGRNAAATVQWLADHEQRIYGAQDTLLALGYKRECGMVMEDLELSRRIQANRRWGQSRPELEQRRRAIRRHLKGVQ